jgi:5-methylthioribose kinase
MGGKAEFQRAHPDVFYLDASDLAGLERYLRHRGWMTSEEQLIGAEPAGPATMNCTLRVRATSRTMILKQSRPWIDKKPDVAAPAERVLVEGHFYTLIVPEMRIFGRMPQLLGLHPDGLMMMLEDLAPATDMTNAYSGMGLSDSEARNLLDYLSALHSSYRTLEYKSAFENRRMRELNHYQIFELPIIENDLQLNRLNPGLSAEAAALRNDAAYAGEVRRLGEIYLENGPALLHGDFFPGCWMRTDAGVRVIDAEFCHFGRPEFDVGTMAAHLVFSKHLDIGKALKHYQADTDFDWELASHFAATEIMRRLVGDSQLPYKASLEQKKRHLNLSRRLMRSEIGITDL